MTSSYSEYVNPFNSNRTKPTKYIDYNMLEKFNQENLCTVGTYLNKDNRLNGSITGIIDPLSKFSLVGTAKYQNNMDNLETFQTLQKYQGIGNSMANSTGAELPQMSFQSLRLSEQQYMGSEIQDMSIMINVPIISSNDNPWEIAYSLLEFVLPVRPNDTQIKSGESLSGKAQAFGQALSRELVLFAPKGYRVKWDGDLNVDSTGGYNDEPQNCATVKIGQRFLFDKVLITRVSCEFNNKIYVNGACTLLNVQFNFKPWRTPTASEVRHWFSLIDGRRT